MAMKALILNSLDKQEEAFALGKEALQADMKSHVCWHVYGLLYRSVKNYEEAIKAYKFALRLDPDSQQIQRDLALLQIQTRDYAGYITSRRAMLQVRSHARQSWTALAVAQHLAGQLSEAEHTLTAYEDTLKQTPPKTDFENSEAVMYKNSLIAEQGDIQRALEHLEKVGKTNLDRVAVMELRAKYLFELGRKEESASAYRALIERNSENKAYYDGLAAALDLKDKGALKEIYDEYAAKFPRSDAARRLPLDFLEGEEFDSAANAYVHRMLDKGVPSTFANLKHLYVDSHKRDSLPKIVQGYIDSKKGQTNGEAKVNGDTSKGDSSALYFLAQHYNYHASRDLTKALEYIDQAIELEPKSVDFHMTKARILKHSGNTQKASEMMEQARQLDIKDRYINTKCAKYQLRNDENAAALKTMGMFTRAETIGGPLADLHDMQCLWYLTEDGEAYARRGNIGLALKRFHSVFKVFEVWQEDQFDFHNFSLRKGQIRAYVEMMRWEDKLREHPAYTRAALSAIKIYLKLADAPKSNGAHSTNGDATEAKKAAKKAKKEAQKAAEEAALKKNEPNKAKDPEAGNKKPDEDPNGLKLAGTTDPLGEAIKFLTPLLDFSPELLEAQFAGFEVLIRRNKLLQALRCLIASHKLSPSHPTVQEHIIRFQHALEKESSNLPEAVSTVIKSESSFIPTGSSPEAVASEYMSKNAQDPKAILAGVSARHFIGVQGRPSDDDILGILQLENIKLDEAVDGLDVIERIGGRKDAYKKLAAEKWPEVTLFSR